MMECVDELYVYQVLLNTTENRTEMYAWCKETWGSPLRKCDPSWTTENSEYAYIYKFKIEAHRTLFLLRWT
jgi:hypothetical protein